jgi:hypothetical protein
MSSTSFSNIANNLFQIHTQRFLSRPGSKLLLPTSQIHKFIIFNLFPPCLARQTYMEASSWQPFCLDKRYMAQVNEPRLKFMFIPKTGLAKNACYTAKEFVLSLRAAWIAECISEYITHLAHGQYSIK